MNDALAKSIDQPFVLVADKFTKGEYWAIGLFHDCPGDNFAKTIYWYFHDQHKHCIDNQRTGLIVRVDEEYKYGKINKVK